MYLLGSLCTSVFKEENPLNAISVFKYPALDNKHFGANMIKIGEGIRKILYFIFYMNVNMGVAILNILISYSFF